MLGLDMGRFFTHCGIIPTGISRVAESTFYRWFRMIRPQDFVWLLLFLTLAATSEFLDPLAMVPLAALGLVQLLEPKIPVLATRRGRIGCIVLKLVLGYLVIGYTGAIESHFWLLLLLPVVTAAATFGLLGTLVFSIVASKEEERRNGMLARSVSRCQAGSRRHALAKRRLLRFRRTITNRVNDARHKLTTRLAQSHGRVFVEDLALRSLTRSVRGTVEAPGTNVAAKAGLNRALLKQGHAETARQLGCKLGWLGGELLKVPAAFTSQRCPECGHTCAGNRPARDRFQCVACGHAGHADNVAARDILAAGQAVFVGGGSREPAKREPTRSRRFHCRPAGIPPL